MERCRVAPPSERFVIKSERRATRNTTGERREKKGKSPQSPFSFIVRAKQVQAPFDLRLKYSYIFQRVFAHAKSEAFFNLQRTSTLYIWNINLSSSQVEISDSVDRAHYSEASFFSPPSLPSTRSRNGSVFHSFFSRVPFSFSLFSDKSQWSAAAFRLLSLSSPV